jgi:hypothetical protein
VDRQAVFICLAGFEVNNFAAYPAGEDFVRHTSPHVFWTFQSHYYIRKNRVKWAPKWSREQIERGRLHDSHAKEGHVGGEIRAEAHTGEPQVTKPTRSWWRAIKTFWS